MVKRVAVLRPEEYINDTLKLFDDRFEIINAPFLKISKSEEGMDKLRQLKTESFDVAIITSQTAARIVADFSSLFKGKKVVAIGKKTAEVLSNADISSEIPSKYDSGTVYDEYKEKVKGKKVILFRSNKGDPILLRLSETADIEEIVLYTIEKEWGSKQKSLIKDVVSGKVDIVLFSSTMMVKSFMELASQIGVLEKVKNALGGTTIPVSIGPPTRNMLLKYGVESIMPDEYTYKGIINLISGLN